MLISIIMLHMIIFTHLGLDIFLPYLLIFMLVNQNDNARKFTSHFNQYLESSSKVGHSDKFTLTRPSSNDLALFAELAFYPFRRKSATQVTAHFDGVFLILPSTFDPTALKNSISTSLAITTIASYACSNINVHIPQTGRLTCGIIYYYMEKIYRKHNENVCNIYMSFIYVQLLVSSKNIEW